MTLATNAEIADVPMISREVRLLKWATLAVCLLAFGLRVAAALLANDGGNGPPRAEQFPDQREYLALGRSVYEARELSFVDPRFNQPTVAFRMPGYPVVIAGAMGNVRAVQILQALFGALTVWGVMKLAARIGRSGASVPLLAGVLAAVNPLSIATSALILTETFTAVVIVWALVALTSRGALARWSAVCLAPGLVLVSPQWGAFGFLATLLAVRLWPVRPRARLAALVVSLLATAVFVVPWAARNRLILGEWMPLTTAGGQTLLDGFGPQADGSSDLRMVLDAMPQLGAMSEPERHHALTTEAMAAIRENPGRLPLLAAAKVARTFSPLPLSTAGRGNGANGSISPQAVVMGVICGVTLFLAGITLLTGGVNAVGAVVASAAVYLAVVVAVSVGSMRYRAAIEPTLTVLAAPAVSLLRRRSAGV